MENTFTSLSKNRTIETATFSIKGNLFFWQNTLIPINNISMISITALQKPSFPLYILFILLGGLGILSFSILIGVLLLALGALLLYVWIKKVKELNEQMNLNILLNSGYTFSILFKNKDFLLEVHKVLTNILTSPEPNANITFDIKNNTFHDKSSMFS